MIKDFDQWLADCRMITHAHVVKSGGVPWSMSEQLCHIHSEVSEVYTAVRKKEGRDRELEEIADVIYSAVTAFHIMGASDSEILGSMETVLEKIAARAGVSLG